jgi:hypothetical protein
MRQDIARWLDECCVNDNSAASRAAELFKSFKTWAKNQGLDSGTICAWGIEMTGHPPVRKVKRGGLIFYKNIRLKSTVTQPQHRLAFDAWLRGQCRRGDPVGDLASDVMSDSKLKRRRFGYTSLLHHLVASRACIDAIIALRDALEEFKQIKKQTIEHKQS